MKPVELRLMARPRSTQTWLLALALLLAGCASAASSPSAAPATEIPVQLTSHALAQPQPCTGGFVQHRLDYTTTSNGLIVTFDSNGAGLAIGDLDADGRLDIVMANLDGPNAILWNQGDFQFRRQDLSFGTS